MGITGAAESGKSDFSVLFRNGSRFWVQRVVVPVLVCLGSIGNIASIVVLTRRKMRSSTNAYLTALAVTDLIYLFFVLILSLKHYPNVNDSKYELYWRFYGICHWLCDAASSSSVWLTVSFTIERYIVVCHPIKGKILCNERRAKNIIALVSILCLVTTISTAFEHQLVFKEACTSYCNGKNVTTYSSNFTSDLPEEQDPTDVNSSQNYPCDSKSSDAILPASKEAVLILINSTSRLIDGVIDMLLLNTTCCQKTRTVLTEDTNLGKDKTYRTIFYSYSSIVFGVLPLVMIATFNCFLISAVYKSYGMRKIMTSSSENRSQSQENRITLLLIAVIALFLLCQTPTAAFLLYETFADEPEDDDEYTSNIKAGLGNIFNVLLALNAACNFLLYCVFSDRYRRTFADLLLRRRGGGLDQGLSFRSLTTIGTGGQRCDDRRLIKRVRSDFYPRTPRNIESNTPNKFSRSKSLMERTSEKASSDNLCA